jgi:hypothetical protein
MGAMDRLKVNERTSIDALHVRGWSKRRIAREPGLDRATVQRHLAAAKQPPRTPGRRRTATRPMPPPWTPGPTTAPEQKQPPPPAPRLRRSGTAARRACVIRAWRRSDRDGERGFQCSGSSRICWRGMGSPASTIRCGGSSDRVNVALVLQVTGSTNTTVRRLGGVRTTEVAY